MERVFPLTLIALELAAGLVYAACGDWRHAGYWIFAALCNGAITI